MRRAVPVFVSLSILASLASQATRAQQTDLYGWPIPTDADLKSMTSDTRYANLGDAIRNSLDHILALRDLFGGNALKESAQTTLQGLIDDKLGANTALPSDDYAALTKALKQYDDSIRFLQLPPELQALAFQRVGPIRGEGAPPAYRYTKPALLP